MTFWPANGPSKLMMIRLIAHEQAKSWARSLRQHSERLHGIQDGDRHVQEMHFQLTPPDALDCSCRLAFSHLAERA